MPFHAFTDERFPNGTPALRLSYPTVHDLCRRLFVVLVGGDGFHQQVDEFFAVDVGGLGGVVHGDSVSQGRAGDGLDISGRGVMAAVQDRSGFGTTDQR